jgi:plastocyanin
MPTIHTVTIYDDGFSDPEPGPVLAGDSVKWVNNGSSVHTATSRQNSSFSFDTGDIAANGGVSDLKEFTVASDHAGFPYWCIHHKEMQSVIKVSSGKAALLRWMSAWTAEQPEPNLFRGPEVAITSLDIEIWPRSVWRAMRQECAAGAC